MDTNYPYAAHFATGTPGMYTTQTAQETAQKDAAKSAITIHDLSTSTAREGEAYNALTDHRGRAVRSNPTLDAQMRAHIQQHRGRIADMNDERTNAWNDPVLFEDGHDVLENMYDGQSHRYQTHAGRPLFDAPPVDPAHAAMSAEPTAGLQRSIHATSPGRGGHGASPRAGPTTDPTAELQRSKHASGPVRGGRGASPRPRPATRATGKAQRSQPAPTPVRRGRETSSRPGPAPKPTGKAQRSQPATTRPRAYSPTAAGTIRDHGGIRQQLPPPPRHQGRAQAAATFPQNGQSGNQSYTLPTQPSAPASLASIPVGRGAGVNSGKDSEESDDQGFEPTHQPKDEHEVDPHKVYAIYELARSDVLSAIIRKKFDGPAISTAKVFLADAAIQSSKPSNEVLNKGPQWVELFHAVRKLFVNKAFDIYELPHRPSHVQIARMTANFTQYRKLMQDIYQAKTMAKHVNPVMRAQWADNNKLDVLEEAVRRYYSQPAATTTITPAIIITPPSEASSPSEPTPINPDLLGPPIIRNGSQGPYLASTGACNLRLFSGGQQLTIKGEDWVPHVVPSGMKVTIDCELHQELVNDSKYHHIGEAYTAALGSVSEILLSAIQLRKPEPLLAQDDDDEEL